jgi:hypothetical protein
VSGPRARREVTALEARLDEATPAAPVDLGHHRVLRRMGAGGMGVVYEAVDARFGHRVALKIVRRTDPAFRARLKREFRSVAEIAHPNLAALYELVVGGDDWYFTMELVEGERFSDQSPSSSLPSAALGATVVDEAEPASDPRPGGDVISPANSGRSDDRLRSIVRQLAVGVHALHQAGKLHRDLKPANVLVTAGDRVVVLDFGLAEDVSAGEDGVLGTPAYMAPEQAAGEPATPASDWYAVGVMIYEALTGRLPFEGTVTEILAAKRAGTPPSPGPIAASARDLAALSADLLRADPAARPRGEEILRRLDLASAAPLRSPTPSVFVGRRDEIATLLDAHAAVAPAHPVAAFVLAPSGIGKTALLGRFASELRLRGDPLILTGRCYACESVPYKAFDGVIEALAKHLAGLDPQARERVVPTDGEALAQVFPALAGVLGRPASGGGARSPEARAVAFRQLKEVLRRLAETRPLVVMIDDLQWGDLDSAKILEEILALPDPPAVLFVGAFRSDEIKASAFLRELRKTPADGDLIREIALGALPREAARALVHHLLAGREEDAGIRTEAILCEASGNPFFLEELARRAEAPLAPALAGAITLDGIVRDRLAELPEESRRLLEVVAVAGRAIPPRAAVAAAHLGIEGVATIQRLRASRLLRATGLGDDDALEAYHDRIRESVTSGLDAATRAAHHRALARELEASDAVDPEELARHFLAGGERGKGVDYALRAAERAEAALAFGRVADLLALVIEAAEMPAGESRALALRRAGALAKAGRGAEAAQLYRACADGAPEGESLWLRQCGAEQMLASGQLKQGIAEVRSVLDEVGVPYPATPGRAAASSRRHLEALLRGGLHLTPRRWDDVPAPQRLALDVCQATARGLGPYDMVRSGFYTVYALMLSLRAGDTERTVRGLILVGLNCALAGSKPAVVASEALFGAARRIAAPLGERALGALLAIPEGAAMMGRRRFREAVERLDAATLASSSRPGVQAIDVARGKHAALLCLEHLGRIHEAARRGHESLRSAEGAGSQNQVSVIAYIALGCLARGGVADARRWTARAAALCPSGLFLFQHWLVLKTDVLIDLYEDRADLAARRLGAAWPTVVRSRLLDLSFVRVIAWKLRGDVALAQRALGRSRRVALAEEAAAELARDDCADASAAEALVRAGIAAIEGRKDDALAALDLAATRYDAVEMELFAAAARRRRGVLLGGAEGRALVAAADARMARERITNPERWTAMYAPGQA